MHLPQENSNYVPAPSGAHVAICIGFLDFGTQVQSFKGEEKKRRVVQLRWELPDELMEDGRPYTVSRKYTWSMSEKAALRKDLEAWRSRPFMKSDFGPGGFNTRKLLGVPCLLNIIHVPGSNGTYAVIDSISPLPKSMPKPGLPKNDFVYLALEAGEFDPGVFAKLHEKAQETIKASPEYRQIVMGEKEPPPPHEAPVDEFEDSIPF